MISFSAILKWSHPTVKPKLLESISSTTGYVLCLHLFKVWSTACVLKCTKTEQLYELGGCVYNHSTCVHTWPDLPGPPSSTETARGWGSCLRGCDPAGCGHLPIPNPCTSASRGFPYLLQGSALYSLSAPSWQVLQIDQVQSGSNVEHPHPITRTYVSFGPSFGTICCDNLIKHYCISFYACLNVMLRITERTKTWTQTKSSEAKSCF